MLFPTPVFLFAFLPLTLALYYALPSAGGWRNLLLLLASLLFYAWGEPVFVSVLLLSVAANWAIGLGVAHDIDSGSGGLRWVWMAVVFNVGVLFVFKYLNFTVDAFNSVFSTDCDIRRIALPVGISFFTFQSLSYVIDVYRRHCSARRNVLDVGLYVSLFPQLIAGPIVRYETVAAEISRRRCSWEDFATGTERFIIGLAKKVLIANNAAVVADYVFDMPPASLSAGAAWLGVFAYHIQIYFDFSGYSDMAIGLGRMFGFHFPENFNHPYISRSVSEFWRRWHISLGSWFRDYLYIPLGGNRKGAWRTVLNLFAVWALTGLWHGANYTFLCWGLMFFVLIMFEKSVRFERWRAGLLRGLMTTFFIMCSWALFRSDSISDAWTYLTAMFGCGADSTDMVSFLWSEHAAVLITGTLFSFPVAGRLSALASGRKWGYAARYAVLLCLLFVSLCYVVKGSYSPFIYFNF